jgi:hypothetical protein
METKIGGKRVEKLASSLGMCGGFAVDSDGLSGGIGIFWSAEVDAEIKSFNVNHIDAIVTPKEGDLTPWRFTGFYGEPRRENRHHSWTLLRRLHSLRKYPWLCVGDFNETTSSLEHFSEHGREEWQMRNFREAIEDCDLQDLGYTGVPFTWDNRQPGAANVKARIDRALANEALLLLYPVFRVQHLWAIQSDHCFLLTTLQKQVTRTVHTGQHVFRYENVWQTHKDYDKIVSDMWNATTHEGG